MNARIGQFLSLALIKSCRFGYNTVFILSSAQPRISAHPVGRKVNKRPASNKRPPHPPKMRAQEEF